MLVSADKSPTAPARPLTPLSHEGMIYYLSFWYKRREIAFRISLCMTGQPYPPMFFDPPLDLVF